MEPLNPDGIALDAEGGIWFGSPFAGVFSRVLEGGEITDRIQQPDGVWAVACALGGDDRRTLFLLASRTSLEIKSRLRTSSDDASSESRGWIQTVEVDVPGVGLP